MQHKPASNSEFRDVSNLQNSRSDGESKMEKRKKVNPIKLLKAVKASEETSHRLNYRQYYEEKAFTFR